MDIQFSGFEIFAPKIELARTVLQRPYASRPTAWELDHLYACRACVGTKLPSDHTYVALHSASEPAQPGVTDIRADRSQGSEWDAYFRSCKISTTTQAWMPAQAWSALAALHVSKAQGNQDQIW